MHYSAHPNMFRYDLMIRILMMNVRHVLVVMKEQKECLDLLTKKSTHQQILVENRWQFLTNIFMLKRYKFKY